MFRARFSTTILKRVFRKVRERHLRQIWGIQVYHCYIPMHLVDFICIAVFRNQSASKLTGVEN